MKMPSLGTRFLRYLSAGPWAGVLACFIMATMYIYWKLVELILPAEGIEECPDIILKPQSSSSSTGGGGASSVGGVRGTSSITS